MGIERAIETAAEARDLLFGARDYLGNFRDKLVERKFQSYTVSGSAINKLTAGCFGKEIEACN